MKAKQSSRYGVLKMWFNKKKKSSKTEIIAQIPGIEPECAEALRELGFETVSQLKSKDAEEMYYELSIRRGEVIEKSVLYGFRCAIYYATVHTADPKKLHWWYWKDEAATDEITDLDHIVEMYKE